MYNLLLKYPSRSRPHLFRKRVEQWTAQATYPSRLHWLCSFHTDDSSMNNDEIKAFCNERGLEHYFTDSGINKVAAINRDIEKTSFAWDVIIQLSDDTECSPGWDEWIDRDLANLDGALWYFDGRQRRINTLSIIGRRCFYEVLNGVIYDPRFESVYCDNYQTDLLQKRGRLKYIHSPQVFRHAWKEENNDELMRHTENEAIYLKDKTTYLSLGGYPMAYPNN